MPPVTLDHTAYPFIFDNILAAADTRTLVAIRATSREMRARIDAALLPHVVRLVRPGGVCAGTSPPDEEEPTKFVGHMRVCDTPNWGNRDQSTAPPPPLLPFVPDAVRAVDMNTTEVLCYCRDIRGYHTTVIPLNNTYPALHTLRRANEAVWSVFTDGDDVHTLVDFAKVDYPWGRNGYIEVPLAKTYVLHMQWNEWDRETSEDEGVVFGLDFSDQPPTRWVLVLSPWPARWAVANRPDLPFPGTFGTKMLRILAEGGEVCIVGADRLSLGGEDNDERLDNGEKDDEDQDNEDEDDPLQLFKARLVDSFNREEVLPDEELEEAMDAIKFITTDEWHASLRAQGRDEFGLDAYEVQAVWPQYA